MRDAQNALENILSIFKEAVLMRVKVRRPDAHADRSLDLRAQLQFHFFGVDVRCIGPIQVEVAVRIDETRDLVAWSDWSPAIEDAFACERQVKSEIRICVRFRILRHLRKPRTRHHDARGGHEPAFEALDRGSVHRMRHARSSACTITSLASRAYPSLSASDLAAVWASARMEVVASRKRVIPRILVIVLKAHGQTLNGARQRRPPADSSHTCSASCSSPRTCEARTRAPHNRVI